MRSKIEVLEEEGQAMWRELKDCEIALGPWYQPEGSDRPVPYFEYLQPSSSRSGADNLPSQSLNASYDPFTPPLPSANADPDILAPFFPPETDRPPLDSQPIRRASLSQLSDPHPSSRAQSSRSMLQNSVAPINLNTTLEGSLSGLRESLIDLSVSVDSLARWNDIALTNETLRINEDVMSLRANIHGLRMQVHAIMMDRNAQVTGRTMPETSQVWREPHPAEGSMVQSPPSITKL